RNGAERRDAAHRALGAQDVAREVPVGGAPHADAERLPIVDLGDAHSAKAAAVRREGHLRDRSDGVEAHRLAAREIVDAHDTAEPPAPIRETARALKRGENA